MKKKTLRIFLTVVSLALVLSLVFFALEHRKAPSAGQA